MKEVRQRKDILSNSIYIKSSKSLLIYGYRNYISWLHGERVWRKEQEERITKELAKTFGKKKFIVLMLSTQTAALDYLLILINTICVFFFSPGGLVVSMEARGLTGHLFHFPG